MYVRRLSQILYHYSRTQSNPRSQGALESAKAVFKEETGVEITMIRSTLSSLPMQIEARLVRPDLTADLYIDVEPTFYGVYVNVGTSNLTPMPSLEETARLEVELENKITVALGEYYARQPGENAPFERVFALEGLGIIV